MKISVIDSTLSCIIKSIRFVATMINKKIILGLFAISFLTACASPTAMLGPAYTLSSTGNALQAGLNYGSNQMITMYTGKTPVENLKEIKNINIKQTKNFKKETLQSEDFYNLIKAKIEKNSGTFKLSTQ